MKNKIICLAVILLAMGCKTGSNPPAEPTYTYISGYKSGNATMIVQPPSLTGGQPNLIAYMSPAPNQQSQSPAYICDPVNLTVSFPQSNSSVTQVITISALVQSTGAQLPGFPMTFCDRIGGPGITVQPNQPSSVTIINDPSMNNNSTVVVTVQASMQNMQQPPPPPPAILYTTVTSTPVDFPQPNNVGYDRTYFSSTALNVMAEIDVQDQNYESP